MRFKEEQDMLGGLFHKKHWEVIDRFIKDGEFTTKYIVVYQCRETGRIKVSSKRL